MASSRLRVLPVLLAAVGLSILIPACGDEEVPAPTTPAPAPTPTPPAPAPEPAPDPPAVPTGLQISASGESFIEWSWTPVPEVSGYDVQYSTNEAFTDEDEVIARTAEQFSYRRTGLAAETSGYLRVRSAAGTGDDRITSDWSTHVTGMTMAAAPAVPATPTNVRVTGRTDTTITWSWNAVEGAAGYQVQHSDSATLADDAPTAFASTTTHTVSRLASRTDHYLRVRAYSGTISEPVFGGWSATVEGATDGPPTPPAPTQLARPTGLNAGTPTRNSIPLEWDEVDDVDRYQVQQQAEGASWGNARCDGSDNEVNDEACVATGLEQGTRYDFRVRAVPAASATGLAASPWSSAITATTTGRATVAVDDGGLNVRWRSEGEDQTGPQITWTWDPVDDRSQQPLIDHYVALLQPTNDLDDCPNLSSAPLPAANAVTDETDSYNKWHDLDSDISFTLTVGDLDGNPGLTGEVRGLCVVRTWEDERKIRQFGEVSVVWATAVPFSTPGNTKRDNTSTSVTTSIGWEFQRDAGFDYVLRLLTTGADTGEATTDAADCAEGQAVPSPDAVGRQNVDIFHTERNPDPYTIYQLCVQAENDYGASEWTFVGGTTGHATSRPAAPSAPTLQADQSNVVRDANRIQTVNSLFWSVRHKAGTPKDGDDYAIAVFLSTEDSIPRNDQIQTRCNAALAAGAGTADILLATDEKLDTSSGFSRYNGNSAFDLEFAPTAAILDSTDAFDQYYFYTCIRADDTPGETDTNHGPWTISRTSGFVSGALLTPGVSGLAVAAVGIPASPATPTRGQFTATWTANPAATRYEIQYVIADTDSVTDPVDTTTVRSTADLEYVVTQSFPSTTNRGSSNSFTGSFRVRYYRTAGGITLRGDWSSVVSDAVTYP